MVPGHARVVIVGGGIVGCSLLYHLATEGWTDCLLIEKAELTSGSTWHAAGAISHATANYALGRISGYGIELYQRLEAETGQSVTWHGCGSLRLAHDDAELDFLGQIMSVGTALGHPMELIGPQAARALHPFYRLDGVRAALHTPADGHVDPAGATQALAKGAQQRGARVVRRTRVLDIKAAPGGEWRVVTERGDVVCECVVNAAGTYARQVGAWVGLDLPVVAMPHHYLVTEPVPEFAGRDCELPVLRDDHGISAYLRQEQAAALIGVYETPAPAPVWTEGTPWDAENELFESDLERIAPTLEAALARVPVLAARGIKIIVHGAITHPPDGLMLLGPAPGLRNVWCACGVPVGIGWGPGAGHYLAQWMVHGAADISLRAFDPRRFGAWADFGYAMEKAREDYVVRHKVPFPGRDRPAARPARVSPLYERLRAEGAVLEQLAGWERPSWFARDGARASDQESYRRSAMFERVAAEVRAVRERAGIMDLSAFAKVDLTGRDAGRLLDRLVANSLPRRNGGIALAHLLNEKGTIEAELTVSRLGDDHFYLLFPALDETRVIDWLEARRQADEDVAIDNLSDSHGCLALAGPASRRLLTRLTQAPLDSGCFPWLTAWRIEVAGIALRALRVSYAGELGWELHVPMEALAALHDAVREAGHDLGLGNFGSVALNAMRLEKAYKGTRELASDVTMAEAGMDRFLRLDKGDFVGRAATLETVAPRPAWRCVYLEIDTGDSDCHGSEAVLQTGRCVGSVTSGGYGHYVGKSLAFAYLRPEFATPGTALEVLVLGKPRAARVLGEAAYDPHGARLRA